MSHTKKHIKRLVQDHGHTASGFLVGLVGMLFVLGLRGSDARMPAPAGRQVSSSPVTAQLILVENTLKPAAQDVDFEASSESSFVSSEEDVPETTSSSSQPQPVLVLPSSSASSSSTEVQPTFPSSSSSVIQPSSASPAPVVEEPPESPQSSEESSVLPATGFPAFEHSSFPVSRTPNWGAMRTPAEWNRSYSQMQESDFVRIPSYDLAKMTVPMASLTDPLLDENIPAITRKLFYSTRFFGAYDLDAGEFSGVHPGVDLKLARGTPIGSIGGGRVNAVSTSKNLGLYVVVEHRLKNGEVYYSVYGHFDSVSVSVGQDVSPGQILGRVGMTGNTSGPHVHLQIDRGQAGEQHIPYAPTSIPSSSEAGRYVVHPITFISSHRTGDY